VFHLKVYARRILLFISWYIIQTITSREAHYDNDTGENKLTMFRIINSGFRVSSYAHFGGGKYAVKSCLNI